MGRLFENHNRGRIFAKLAGFLVLGYAAISVQPFAASAANAELTALFKSDDMLDIRIELPMRPFLRNAASGDEEFEGKVVLIDGGTEIAFDVKLSARGKSRRNRKVCRFPPIRLDFKKKQVTGTLFDGQNRIKLVTHCQETSRFQQFYLIEHAIYQAYNILTPFSFRVRMARITYRDSLGKSKDNQKYAFFIEDVDDLALRHGYREYEKERIHSRTLNPEIGAIYGLFQFMIGNLDWSAVRGPAGDECCHNTKLLALPDQEPGPGNLIPVPYDFDVSGIVGAPYAVPPLNVDVKSVQDRLYRGFCRHEDLVPAAIILFQQHRAALVENFSENELLTKTTQRRTGRYVRSFFQLLDNPERVQKEIIARCRGGRN